MQQKNIKKPYSINISGAKTANNISLNCKRLPQICWKSKHFILMLILMWPINLMCQSKWRIFWLCVVMKIATIYAIMYLVNWSIASQLNLIENFNIKPSHSFNAYLIGHPHSATQSHIVMNTLRTPLISSFNIIKNVQYIASLFIAFDLALIFKPFSKWKFTAFFHYFAFALW